MNQFHDSMDRAAKEFLEDRFGIYEYNITDGDMDEGWLDAEVAGSGDYEAYNVRVDYKQMSGYTFLTHIRIECSFPDQKGYDEVCGYDEETEYGDVGSDFREEVSNECGALFGGEGGHTVGFMPNHYLEFHEDADDIIIIEINIGLDEEETSLTYELTEVNAALKKLKEMIDSYKKKNQKNG